MRNFAARWVLAGALLAAVPSAAPAAAPTADVSPAPDHPEQLPQVGPVSMAWAMRVTGRVVSAAGRAARPGCDVRLFAVTDKASFLSTEVSRTDRRGAFDLRLDKAGRPVNVYVAVKSGQAEKFFEITPLIEKSLAADSTRIDVTCLFPAASR